MFILPPLDFCFHVRGSLGFILNFFSQISPWKLNFLQNYSVYGICFWCTCTNVPLTLFNQMVGRIYVRIFSWQSMDFGQKSCLNRVVISQFLDKDCDGLHNGDLKDAD